MKAQCLKERKKEKLCDKIPMLQNKRDVEQMECEGSDDSSSHPNPFKE